MSVPRTALRERYELIQERGVDRQTRECVDYLENPEVFMAEFVDSYRAMERFAASGRRMPRGVSPDPEHAAHLLELLVGREQIEVPEFGGYAFRLVAAAGGRPAPPGLIDYVGVRETEPPTPILGAMAASSGESPYLTLLRLLTGLAEVAPASCFRVAAGELFGGSIQPPAAFDLHLVLSDATPRHRSEALHQLTRDLAQAFRTRVEEEWHLPNPVWQISCFELDAKQFEGVLSLVWSV